MMRRPTLEELDKYIELQEKRQLLLNRIVTTAMLVIWFSTGILFLFSMALGTLQVRGYTPYPLSGNADNGKLAYVKSIMPEEIQSGDRLLIETVDGTAHFIGVALSPGYESPLTVTDGENNSMQIEGQQVKGEVYAAFPGLGWIYNRLENLHIFYIVVILLIILSVADILFRSIEPAYAGKYAQKKRRGAADGKSKNNHCKREV